MYRYFRQLYFNLPQFQKRVKTTFNYAKSFLTKGAIRSVNTKKNILFSLLIRGGSIIVTLLLVPICINYVNATQFGIWVTLSSVIGWFSFFDIGLGQGLRNKLAEALSKGQHKLARIYISTTYAIVGLITSGVLLIFYILNRFLNWTSVLNAPSQMGQELKKLALFVFVFFCLQFVLQLLNSVLTAHQQVAKVSFINFVGNLFSLVVIYVISKTTRGNLLYLGVSLGLSPLLVLVVSSIWYYKNSLHRLAPSFKLVKFRFAKYLMNLGLKFFIIQIAVVVIYQTDTIIIAQLFGPKEVTAFNLAYKLFGLITMIFSIVLTPFLSAFTEAYFKKDMSWITSSIKKLVKLWGWFAAVTMCLLLASNLIYRAWIGSSVKIPFSLSAILAVYVIINAWCSIFSVFLNGVGKVKLMLFSGLTGTIVNIPLSILLAKVMGISGVIMSTCVLSVISAIWSPIQYYKIINNKATGIWQK